MIDSKSVIDIAERHLADSDMFVVECKVSPMGDIELLIDSDTAVRLEDCAALNRAIEAELDREVEDYSLMVASAGIGSELKQLRQYKKILGSSVEVLLKDGVKVLAKLNDATEQGIQISYEEKQLVEGKKRKVTVEVTKDFKGLNLNIAMNYGGQHEIVHAARKAAQEILNGNLNVEDITPETFGKMLYFDDCDSVDLVIRPSGEKRLSNFLLWQSAYAEFWYSDILWPDFKPKDLDQAIIDFQKRNRRFGGV